MFNAGAIGRDAEPRKEADYVLLFDFNAIDVDELTYFIGLHQFIYCSHKKTNCILMQESDRKRILYLRGFDYEGSVKVGGGIALGFSSKSYHEAITGSDPTP